MSRLSRFDAHAKTLEGVQIKTMGGAAVTVSATVFVVILLLSELSTYATTEVVNHMTVDTSPAGSAREVPIHLHVTFPHLTCDDLHLDLDGAAADHAVRFDDNLVKTPWPPAEKEGGKWFGKGKKSKRNNKNSNDKKGSADGGETPKGCEIKGDLQVAKVAGNFHVALGSKQIGGMQMNTFSLSEMERFNTSHTIHKLAFGDPFPGHDENPLEGVVHINEKGLGQVQYFMKAVPSTYKPLWGRTKESYQYSVTEHFIKVDMFTPTFNFVQPGVYFRYDFSPIQVSYEEQKPSIFQFATRLCAIVGGVFAVAKMLDGMVYSTAQALSGKQD